MVLRRDMSDQRHASSRDRNFHEAMMPSDLDQLVNSFIRWANSTKLGGGPAPAVKMFVVGNRAWQGYYAITKWSSAPAPDLTVEEWNKMDLWPFYICYTREGLRANPEQRIEILSQVMPNEEEHRIKSLANYDAIFFVHAPTNERYGRIGLDEDTIHYYAGQCLCLLEAWHNRP